jgi:hypothetical protein
VPLAKLPKARGELFSGTKPEPRKDALGVTDKQSAKAAKLANIPKPKRKRTGSALPALCGAKH